MNEIIEINGATYQKILDMDPDYFIVRTYSAGVFFGIIKERNGKEGTLINARRIWKWAGAFSLSQMAVEGVKKPKECKFDCIMPEINLTEIIETIRCTKEAKKNLQNVPVWDYTNG